MVFVKYPVRFYVHNINAQQKYLIYFWQECSCLVVEKAGLFHRVKGGSFQSRTLNMSLISRRITELEKFSRNTINKNFLTEWRTHFCAKLSVESKWPFLAKLSSFLFKRNSMQRSANTLCPYSIRAISSYVLTIKLDIYSYSQVTFPEINCNLYSFERTSMALNITLTWISWMKCHHFTPYLYSDPISSNSLLVLCYVFRSYTGFFRCRLVI